MFASITDVIVKYNVCLHHRLHCEVQCLPPSQTSLWSAVFASITDFIVKQSMSHSDKLPQHEINLLFSTGVICPRRVSSAGKSYWNLSYLACYLILPEGLWNSFLWLRNGAVQFKNGQWGWRMEYWASMKEHWIKPSNDCLFPSSWSSTWHYCTVLQCHAYMGHQTWLSLLQIMPCHLFSAKPLSELMQVDCQLNCKECIFLLNFISKSKVLVELYVSKDVVCKMAAILACYISCCTHCHYYLKLV